MIINYMKVSTDNILDALKTIADQSIVGYISEPSTVAGICYTAIEKIKELEEKKCQIKRNTMQNDICDRLTASLKYDAINGDTMERNILKSQIRDAISTIESLEDVIKSENITGQLEWLKEQGCHPSLYRRGNLWRVHINMAGNWWAEDKSLSNAVSMAIDAWIKGGKIMDGASQDV